MAKPRIFLSSTCYDLSRVRHELNTFLEERGFEVLNSEASSFGVAPGLHSHSACIQAVNDADFLLLLIGQRGGGTYIGSTKSITNEEYNRAIKRGIPCIACVDRKVFEYIKTYKKNPSGDHKHVVDDVRVFHFIDNIQSGHVDNWLHAFEFIEDIKKIVTSQLANYLRLYSQGLLGQGPSKQVLENVILLAFPQNLDVLKKEKLDQDDETGLRNGLMEVHSIITEIQKANIKNDSKLEKLKVMWVMGTKGECEGDYLGINFERFKQWAWSRQRGARVFEQMKEFRMRGALPEDQGDTDVILSFVNESPDYFVASALADYAGRLLKTHGEDEGYERFKRADMMIYQDFA